MDGSGDEVRRSMEGVAYNATAMTMLNEINHRLDDIDRHTNEINRQLDNPLSVNDVARLSEQRDELRLRFQGTMQLFSTFTEHHRHRLRNVGRNSRSVGSTRNNIPDYDIRDLEYIMDTDDNLVCPICRCPFIAPVALPCQHIFCIECIFDAAGHQPQEKQCPSCRTVFKPESMKPVQRLILRILDDLRVKCPSTLKGCTEVIPRSSIETHLEKYCGYRDIPCPSPDCELLIPRRLASAECLHKFVECPDCSTAVSMLLLEAHHNEDCDVNERDCPDCHDLIEKKNFKQHEQKCEERWITCVSSPYGCNFTSKRRDINAHQLDCPLAKLAPFMHQQNGRLEDLSAQVKHLRQKTSIHESFIDRIQETLAASQKQRHGGDDLMSSDSNLESPASHLLSLHETLRGDVARLTVAVADLNARTDTAFLNTSLRASEEAAHRDAVIAQLRIQVQWLLASRATGSVGNGSTRMTSNILGSGVNRDIHSVDRESNQSGNSRITGLVRRASDGTSTSTSAREKL